MQKPETKFKTRIRPLLNAIPSSWWVKAQFIAIRGIPDFIGCINGYFVALELKVDDRESKLQGWVLDRIKRAGGVAFVVTPENWPDVFHQLKGISQTKVVDKRPFHDS